MKHLKQIIQVKDLTEIKNAAKLFVSIIEKNKIVAFFGEMGAGKTTFIKYICEELNVKDIVTSPTFSLINEYKIDDFDSVFHFDFYRINKLSEVYDMGYEEYFYGGKMCLIEWPEKIEELLPDNYIKVNITVNIDSSRTITINI